ncbi:unnamed protein product [Caenorhabditis auriculariae]|uniref:Rab3 GTPase-activating protein catalytic subunit n=1 Tax=Caenorhabditis auriculariae TaxID=2777116 RepID=A0A8S1GXU6_9PELO|nr:unnamed protein product [Caenorhabditis auriculariae]
MSNEASDSPEDGEVFEINDFTVITDLEEFAVSVDGLVTKWDLVGRRPIYPDTKEIVFERLKTELKYGDADKVMDAVYVFPKKENEETVKKHCFALRKNLENSKSDFKHNDYITKMFGCTEYVLLTPQGEENSTSEDDRNFVVSAIRSALHSIRCEVPFFVQFNGEERPLYFGFSSDGEISYQFQMLCLYQINKRHTNLSGLLSLFKDHLRCPPEIMDTDDIKISANFHYSFEEYNRGEIKVLDSETLLGPPIGFNKRHPLKVTVTAGWTNFREDALIENESHSDFDPIHATDWKLSTNFEINPGLLSAAMDDFAKRKKADKKSAKDQLRMVDSRAAEALGLLTGRDGIASLRIGEKSAPSDPISPDSHWPLPGTLVVAWLGMIFHGVEDSREIIDAELKEYYTEKHHVATGWQRNDAPRSPEEFLKRYGNSEPVPDMKSLFPELRLKAAPEDSISERLANAFAHARVSFPETHIDSQLWLAFTRRLRNYYDTNQSIGLSTDIDLSSSLLNQKLQLFEACIEAKKRRHLLLDSGHVDTNDAGTDEDDFFDANSDVGSEPSDPGKVEEKEEQRGPRPPVGRLHQLGKLCLIDNPEEKLYVPITQDRSPMTEDMLERHSQYLFSLSEEERVEAQLDPLRSDMSAFKAANPGAQLADFLRWHSNKDYDEETKTMSERMSTPGNSWIRCWESANPIPVVSQARLFNETKLAEEILTNFESIPMEKVCDLLRPVFFANAFRELCIAANDLNHDKLKSLGDKIKKATFSGHDDDYNDAVTAAEELDQRALCILQVKNKFYSSVPSTDLVKVPGEIDKLVRNCVENFFLKDDEDNGPLGLPFRPLTPIGRCVQKMMATYSNDSMATPEEREYVLHWSIPRPLLASDKMPHRMYASIGNNTKNIIATSVGSDVNFNIQPQM